MSMIHVEASSVIEASPKVVYNILSDYHKGHRAILPKPYFTEMIVEEGGQGAGTIVTTHMNVMGTKYTFRLVVTEPEPGRILQEEDKDAGIITTFTVDPTASGQHSKVTIASDSKASAGLRGFLEKIMNPPITRRIYRAELALLAQVAKEKMPTPPKNI